MTTQDVDMAVITTVLPTYQRPDLLRRAVASVVEQSFASWRLCVCDNGSDSETEEFMRGLTQQDARVEYHRHRTNIGAVRNFKFGLDRVSTPFFSFLSDDDLLLPGFYETGLALLEKDHEAGFVATEVLHTDSHGKILQYPSPTTVPGRYLAPEGLLQVLEPGLPMWHGMVFRHEVVQRVGSLKIEAGMAADLDFMLRAACHFPFLVADVPGAAFSHSVESISDNRSLSATWPNWLALIESVENQPELPRENRERAVALLVRMLIDRLYAAGLAASRRGDFAEAAEAEDLLRERYDQSMKASAVHLVAMVCRRFPRVIPRLRQIRRRWLSYRRHSPQPTGVELNQMIESLGAPDRSSSS
jgi:GT2 family glycosyltransferase